MSCFDIGERDRVAPIVRYHGTKDLLSGRIERIRCPMGSRGMPGAWLAVTVLSAAFGAVRADTGRLAIKVDRPGVKISPMLYGLMTEEINHSYDGGLYGELIRNRSFKDDKTEPVHWTLV